MKKKFPIAMNKLGGSIWCEGIRGGINLLVNLNTIFIPANKNWGSFSYKKNLYFVFI